MMYNSLQTPIPDTDTNAHFENNYKHSGWIQGSRNTVHMMCPLNFDIACSNSYLLDNVVINIPLELPRPICVCYSSTMKITSIEWKHVNYGVKRFHRTLQHCLL